LAIKSQLGIFGKTTQAIVLAGIATDLSCKAWLSHQLYIIILQSAQLALTGLLGELSGDREQKVILYFVTILYFRVYKKFNRALLVIKTYLFGK